MMKNLTRVASLAVGAAFAAAAFISFSVPGCIDQNQDNSPISISNSQGRLVLSVTCSTDGSVAYVTDGRNVYRYDRNASGNVESWECILSQGERLEMAVRHDPREEPPADGAPQNPDQKKPDGTGGQNAGK